MPLNRYLGVKKEATFGAGATSYDKFYRIATESIEPVIEYEFDEDTITGFDYTQKYAGPMRAEGSIELYLNPNEIGHFLLGLLGAKTTTPQGSPVVAYQHVFTPADDLPSLALIIGRDIDAEIVKGAIVTGMSFEFDATSPRISVSADILAREASTGAHAAGVTFTTVRDFNSSEVSVMLGGVSKRPRELSLEISNNIADDYYTLGGGGRLEGILRSGKREITGSMTLYFQSTAEYNDFLSGTERGLVITVTDGVISGSYNYRIEFSMPRIVFEEVSVEESGVEPILAEFGFRALKPSGGPILTVTLVNDQSDFL